MGTNYAGQPLARFRLPLDRNVHQIEEQGIEVSPDAPGIVILGIAGTGKTVLALSLARQFLEEPAPEVHYLTGEGTKINGEPWPTDLAMNMLARLREQHPDRMRCHECGPDDTPGDLVRGAPAGSLVIVDDAFEIPQLQEESAGWMSWAAEQGFTLILVGQDLRDLFPVGAHAPEGEEKIAVALVSMIKPEADLGSTPAVIREAMRVASTMHRAPRLPGQFLAASRSPKRAWLVRYTRPDLLKMLRHI